MKKSVFLITFILLIVNGLLGLILHTYHPTNVCLNTMVILLSGIVLWTITSTQLKDAFKVSLTSLFVIVGAMEYILGFFASTEWSNNWFAILMIVVLAIEIIIILLTNYVTNKNERI